MCVFDIRNAASFLLITEDVDLLALVCMHCDYPTAVALVGSHFAAWRHARDDGFWRIVAIGQWGEPFWRDAAARPSRHFFWSMRNELKRIDALHRAANGRHRVDGV